MNVLLLHGSGWDEFLLLGGAVLLAFLIIRLSSRGKQHEADDSSPEESTGGTSS